MRIEVGKTYIDRQGSKVTIVREEDNHPLPFVGDDGCGYTADGEFYDGAGGESKFDLITERTITGDTP